MFVHARVNVHESIWELEYIPVHACVQAYVHVCVHVHLCTCMYVCVQNLSGHHGPVTAIKFDRWHIVTGSRDGYALAWSALGRHNRCLTALRHPK